MATASDVVKDALLLYDRLFNHRPALGGEIKYLVRELETKRNDRELTRLKDVQAKVERIDRTLPECEELAEKRLKVVNESLLKASQLLDSILSEKLDEEHLRQELTEKRDKEWGLFQQEMQKTREEIEKIHQARIEKLEEEFSSSHEG